MARIKDVYEEAEALAVRLDYMSGALMLAENAAQQSSANDIEHTFGCFRGYVDSLRGDMEMLIEGIRLAAEAEPEEASA